jgi:hypothetical protein
MKKALTIAAVMALVTGIASAATASWKISGQLQQGSDTKVAKNDTSYMLVLCYSSDSTISASVSEDGKLNMGGDTALYSGAPEAAGGTGTTGKTHDTAGDGTYYYVMLFNKDGAASTSAFTHYAISSGVTGNPNAVAPDTPIALKWTSSASYTPSPIPEPTAIALIALGLAAFGLKRKVA